jgi:hypothetical protein
MATAFQLNRNRFELGYQPLLRRLPPYDEGPVFPAFDLAIDLRVLGFTIAAAMLTGVLFGMAPAWKGTRVDPQAAMKANARGIVDAQTHFGLGKSLVVVQVALSTVLVGAAGLLLNTFLKLTTIDAGFDANHILLVNVDLRNANYPKERRTAGFDEMLDHLRAVPGVRSAAASNLTRSAVRAGTPLSKPMDSLPNPVATPFPG